MTSNSAYLLTLIVLILLSGVFSAVETSFSSASKIRLRSMANDGNESAKKVLKILDHFDRFLTTILIGNNVVNIASATIGTVLFTRYFQANGPTISTIVMTVVVLLFGETTPKSIAKMIPERFSCHMVGFVQVMVFLLFTAFEMFQLRRSLKRYDLLRAFV